MISNSKKIYKDYVANNFIHNDNFQLLMLENFNQIYMNREKLFSFSKVKKFNGIYLYGSVGIGKTFLINLFIKNIKNSKKYHFNHFMINLHAFIHNNKKN